MASHRVLAGVLPTVVLIAAACSGGRRKAAPPPGVATTSPSAVAATTAATGSCPASSGLSGSVNDRGATAAKGQTIAVEAGDFFFAPTCVTGTARGTVSLTVTNTGVALHNVTIAAQGIDKDVAPGETITVQFRVGGDAVQYACKYHRTSGMVGALIPAGS